MQTKTRFIEVDLLRTVAILFMIAYHLAFDVSVFYGWNISLHSPVLSAVQHLSASLFLLLVGVSFVLSWQRMEDTGWTFAARQRRTYRRALRIFVFALLISVATYIFDPAEFIRFGILHLIAASLLILPLVIRLKEANALLGILCLFVGAGVRGTQVESSLFLPFGITPPTFATLDYFPLFPWLGVVLIGVGIGQLLYVRFPRWRTQSVDRIIAKTSMMSVPGRHSLVLYIIHQPILLLILSLLYGWPAHLL